eukprot:gene2606-805_t
MGQTIRVLKKRPCVTDENLREYSDAFITYDSNHKGYLTKKEVTKTMKKLGFNPTDTDCQNIELEIVHKRRGKVGFKAFVDFISTHCDTEKEDHEIVESFRAFDRTNKGFASSVDIREVLLDVMETCSQTDKDQILKVFQLDVDRQVSLEEFKKMIIPANID